MDSEVAIYQDVIMLNSNSLKKFSIKKLFDIERGVQ